MSVLGVPCRVCRAAQGRFLSRNVNEHSDTRLLDSCRCAACGSVYIANAVTGTELEQAYASLDETTYYRETAAASAPKFERAARDVAGLAAPWAAVLDLGGGHGAFVRALQKQGFGNLSIHEIPGADLPDLADVAVDVFRDADYRTLPAATFDVVTMMDVMEHVPDIDATMAAVRRALRPRGILYAHTPVVTALDRVMHAALAIPGLARLGRAWQRTRTTIFHLQNFTPRGLEGLAARHGFDVERLDCINELSWRVARYVRVYLVEKQGLPRVLAPLVTGLLMPLLRSRLNRNKAVLVARLRGEPASDG